jgi:hypothetical protein
MAGLSVRIQRSANLKNWEDWQTLTLGSSPSELSDFEGRRSFPPLLPRGHTVAN